MVASFEAEEMHMTGKVKLVAVGNQVEAVVDQPIEDPEVEPEPSAFKAEIEALIEARKTEVVERWKKWMLFWADFGATTLVVEECPVIGHDDREIVIAWCSSEGFEIKKPRWMSKVGTTIVLAK
jgi:hypothetical protein